MPINMISPLLNDSEPLTQDTGAKEEPKVDQVRKKRYQAFRQEIDICKPYRRKLAQNWTVSIDNRRGKQLASMPDDDTVTVNLDWPMTKAKIASLFSQIPQVRVNHQPESATVPWIAQFEKHLNETLVMAGIESVMDETLPDCINASGFGAAIVSYEALTEEASVPQMDTSTLPPEIAAMVLQSGKFNGEDVGMESVPRVVDRRYLVQRISPSDFLWPLDFTGANFDNAPWIGRSGRIPWAEAVQRFNLKESDKDAVLGEDRQTIDRLNHDTEKDSAQPREVVGFDEIFYKSFQYDTDVKMYGAIHHLVFINGKDEPVIDEPWKGQKIDPETKQIQGALRFPVRVLTLTYITDETIPPSDSAVGRPQVNEINKFRTQMIRQRERNLPVRWIDVNRIDPAIQTGLMRGTWQHFIPVQGDGSRAIGEVARASMPQDNYVSDKVARSDWNEICTLGPNQRDSGEGVDTAAEANVLQGNFQVKVGRERAKVSAFFVSIAEVIGGLMCLYEDPAALGEGFDPSFNKALKYSILADSTVLVDAQQRLERLNKFVDLYGKSGWVDLESVLKEIATLTGLDPNTAIKPPEPKPPVEPNISLRLTGWEDMSNPLLLAFLLQSGQAPPPELIEKAKQLIQQSVVVQQPPPPADPNAPAPPPGAGPVPPPVPAPPSGAPQPVPPPPGPGEANPQMSAMPTISKRSEGTQG